MAAAMSTVKVRVEPELSEDLRALLGNATEDTLNKVNAGAQLVHALYHCPADVITGLPSHVHLAIMRAQEAYGVGRHGSGGVGMIHSDTTTDPVMLVEDR